MSGGPPEAVLADALLAARSKLNHTERAKAAQNQRDAAYAKLHALNWSYATISKSMRAALKAEGLSSRQIAECGVGLDNIRRAVRLARES